MSVSSLLRDEMYGFLGLLAGVIVYQLLTRRIRLDGIFRQPNGAKGVSPARVQLLVSTLWLSVSYLEKLAHCPVGRLPEISADWLYVFGASSGTYLGLKALHVFRRLSSRI